MNPYDFARIDWKHPPERRKPIWHNRLFDVNGPKLYSGHMEIDVFAETPLFIFDPRSKSSDKRQGTNDPTRPEQFIQNEQEEYILPGSSLKGMLRSVVETLGNACLTLFDGQYTDDRNPDNRRRMEKIEYKRNVAREFQHCETNTELCIACRTFGMLKERGNRVFLGKVNIGDARAYADSVALCKPMYTAVLSKPKPHHRSFYLDEEERYIAGRKFYFHHDLNQILTASRFVYTRNNPKPTNRYIQPLDYDTRFHFRLDFTNLEADEFAHLMQAIILDEGMRHKIGYGKPLGLGTIELQPTSLTLIDYAARYTQPGANGGLKTREGNEMWNYLYDQIDSLPTRQRLNAEEDDETPAQDLRRIWQWPPDSEVDYVYPGKHNWFDRPGNATKRIIDTEYALPDPMR